MTIIRKDFQFLHTFQHLLLVPAFSNNKYDFVVLIAAINFENIVTIQTVDFEFGLKLCDLLVQNFTHIL